MTKVAACVAGLLLVAIAGAACGDGGGAPSEPQDAASILGQAHTAMSDLDSFRAVMTTEPGQGILDSTVEWQSPDSFHLVIRWQEQQEEAVGEIGLSEAIVIGDKGYSRQCKAEGEGCSEWTEYERGDTYLPAPTPWFDPRWPIVALALVVDSRVVGEEQIDGVSSTHIQGNLNRLRAMLQALEEGLRQRGVTAYGQECETEPGEPEECRDLPIEEFMESQAEELQLGDENPNPVDIWIGRDDKLLHRYTIGPIPGDAGAPGGTLTTVFTYSQFNKVEIQPPE